jgi:hypothetical protein
MGVICPIYKQGDQNKCERYKGIMLLSCIHKVLSRIISNRLTEYAEKSIGVCQNAFRINRGTFDNILVLRQIIDKAYECNTQIVIWRMDFRQAFDNIYRCKMIKIQSDSKRWTQFCTSIFPELYMVCE